MTEKALKPIKPFLNYEEQINNLIEQKGMIVNDHKFTVSKLEDISYFALIDGYKNLFYNPMTRKYKEVLQVLLPGSYFLVYHPQIQMQ